MLTVTNCTIRDNSANGSLGASGGGIYDNYALTVTNSTISGNSTIGPGSSGGGIQSVNATLTVTNSTISGNSANASFGDQGDAYGGGIWADTLTVTNSTISGNSAIGGEFGYGGGIYGQVGFNLSNSIVANNTANAGGPDIFGGFSGSYNLVGVDPMLGPLQNNGGPTFTRALMTGSPAINAGDPNFTPPPNYDQRGTGYPRVVNGRIDIGAFEVQPAYAAQVQQPINADGTSVFNVRRGVVPVKFTLTLNGVATCDLPPATIAVTRTAGGTIGAIDESIYIGAADTGSNFRINSCQYVYNLSASALGVGTYRVDIMINGQVVGSATFQLK